MNTRRVGIRRRRAESPGVSEITTGPGARYNDLMRFLLAQSSQLGNKNLI